MSTTPHLDRLAVPVAELPRHRGAQAAPRLSVANEVDAASAESFPASDPPAGIPRGR